MSRFKRAIIHGLAVFVGLLVWSHPALSEQKDDSARQPVLVIYPVADLPVWRLDSEGESRFDATLLIALLKAHVPEEAWNESSTIVPLVDKSAILINQTREVHEEIRRALERFTSFAAEDAPVRTEHKLTDAQFADQQVLVFVADPNSDSTKQFFQAKWDDEDQELQEALDDYQILCVRHDQTEFLNAKGLTVPGRSGATLAILGTEGPVVAELRFEDLCREERLDPTLLADFLNVHRIALGNASDLLSDACTEAAKLDKRVLVQVSGPNCGPCIVLSRFLAGQADLIQKDYVHVKLDTRMEDAAEVIDELRGTESRSVPWMVILTADRRPLVTSEDSGANIGYPRTEQSKAHFQHMLQSTSQRLTAAEVDGIVRALDD